MKKNFAKSIFYPPDPLSERKEIFTERFRDASLVYVDKIENISSGQAGDDRPPVSALRGSTLPVSFFPFFFFFFSFPIFHSPGQGSGDPANPEIRCVSPCDRPLDLCLFSFIGYPATFPSNPPPFYSHFSPPFLPPPLFLLLLLLLAGI